MYTNLANFSFKKYVRKRLAAMLAAKMSHTEVNLRYHHVQVMVHSKEFNPGFETQT